HAQVLGLDHDDGSARLQDAHERIGDLRGEPLLDLWAPGVYVDQPGELRQAGDAAVLTGDVADLRTSVEGHAVMLAGAVHLDVAHDHHLVMPDVEHCGEHII